MKHILLLVLLIAVIGMAWCCGCTGTSPQAPGTASGISGTQRGATAAPPGTAGIAATSPPGQRTVLDERIILMSGYQTTYQKYAFEDYGYQYLYPDDTFRISVHSDKPVNVLVIDKNDEIKFPSVEPEWNTVLKKDQWDYSPLVPAFSQSNVVRKDMTFKIEDKSSYFIIIDPRFASDQAGWRGSRHDEVHVDIAVTKQ
ncbi:MAG: hypothetical protein MUP10_00920 [Methanoregulaceae archaeon]|nr:hypothetical protein [Methanoregulaceae archaeon]